MGNFEKYSEEYDTKCKIYEDCYVRSAYYDARKKYDIEEKTILYEAFYGRGVTCNPGQLFIYLINDKRFSEYKHIYVLEESEFSVTIMERYKAYKNVTFVKPNSEEYFKALSVAKYLINNSTWMNYFVKKEGQVLINTWHGIPLKSLGYDEPDGNIAAANTVRNFLMSDFILSPVDFTTENFKKAYKLEGLFEGKIIEAGYPRIDATVNVKKEETIEQLCELGVNIDKNKKIILYAPTWRGDNFANVKFDLFEYENFVNTISKYIDTDEYQILLKPHQQVYKRMQLLGIERGDFVPACINTNELLGITDVLISDYSSIFFDFLVTGKPILFYIPDVKEYMETRGLYMPISELPGPISEDLEQIGEWVGNIKDYKNMFDYSKYELAQSRFVYNDDGHVCEKVVKAIFEGEKEKAISLKNKKKKILIHTDVVKANGISSSAQNLLNNINTDKYDVTFFAAGQKEYISQYTNKIKNGIRVLVKVGAAPINSYDYARREYCLDKNIIEIDNDKMFPKYFYETEYKRFYGDSKFDIIVNFSGFSAYYANILFAEKKAKQYIWMHNVMLEEYNRPLEQGTRGFKKNLDSIFKLYPYLDGYVSCSKTTMLKNREDLSNEHNFSKFKYAHNLINGENVVEQKNKKRYVNLKGKKYLICEDYSENKMIIAPCNFKTSFVTMGRLSDAKNQENLIRAFADFSKDNPDSVLYIIGDGPLAQKLRKVIISLKMSGKIVLTGNMLNPFSIIDDCDCFVLPSHYEGQPMVLLEARIIGIPIIVSNFSTISDSIYEGGQLVIGMDKGDILEGLELFMEGKVLNEYQFKYKDYNACAMKEFEDCLEVGVSDGNR